MEQTSSATYAVTTADDRIVQDRFATEAEAFAFARQWSDNLYVTGSENARRRAARAWMRVQDALWEDYR